MTVGAIADIHGNFDAMRRAIERHPDVPFWLCVGDVASRTGAYPEPAAPVYWIKGNNEDFDTIAAWEAGAPQPRNLHYIRNGTAASVGTISVAGLGGTFAPTWYETPASALPHVRAADDKRRHFVREEVEACKRLRDVDILLTHEAPRPFRVKGNDAGKTPINEILAAMKPRLHLFGHHHRFAEAEVQGVRSVCLDVVGHTYLLVDVPALRYHIGS